MLWYYGSMFPKSDRFERLRIVFGCLHILPDACISKISIIFGLTSTPKVMHMGINHLISGHLEG